MIDPFISPTSECRDIRRTGGPISRRRSKRRARPNLESLETREVMSAVATSTLGGVSASFLLNNGSLWEKSGSHYVIKATGVQGLYQSKDSSGHKLAFDLAKGTLNEFTPKAGWVGISPASQLVMDDYQHIFVQNGSQLLEATGVARAAGAGGATVVATGVTKLGTDSAGEVVVLQGAHGYSYFNGALGSSSVSPTAQYALDGQSNLYALQSGVLTKQTSRTSAPVVVQRGVTQMAMDAVGQVVVIVGLHSYDYYGGVIGSSGSSPSADYAVDIAGFLYTLQGGIVTSQASSSSYQVTVGSSGIAAADGSLW